MRVGGISQRPRVHSVMTIEGAGDGHCTPGSDLGSGDTRRKDNSGGNADAGRAGQSEEG